MNNVYICSVLSDSLRMFLIFINLDPRLKPQRNGELIFEAWMIHTIDFVTAQISTARVYECLGEWRINGKIDGQSTELDAN